jgi:hypothetical protein
LLQTAKESQLDATVFALDRLICLNFKIPAFGKPAEALPEGPLAARLDLDTTFLCVGQAAIVCDLRKLEESLKKACESFTHLAVFYAVTGSW